jgi:hypothetical protein
MPGETKRVLMWARRSRMASPSRMPRGSCIVATSPRNPTFARNWSPFSEGIDARIYIGFHFRHSDETGARIGRQVARFVFNHAPRLRGPSIVRAP